MVEINSYVGIVLSLLVGVINGLLVYRVHLNPFVVTLAMLILLRGISQGIAHGNALTGLPAAYTYLGSASWYGVPVSVVLAAALFLVAGFLLRLHRWGRAVYAVGGNERGQYIRKGAKRFTGHTTRRCSDDTYPVSQPRAGHYKHLHAIQVSNVLEFVVA